MEQNFLAWYSSFHAVDDGYADLADARPQNENNGARVHTNEKFGFLRAAAVCRRLTNANIPYILHLCLLTAFVLLGDAASR